MKGIDWNGVRRRERHADWRNIPRRIVALGRHDYSVGMDIECVAMSMVVLCPKDWRYPDEVRRNRLLQRMRAKVANNA